jgi:hypothetical protein
MRSRTSLCYVLKRFRGGLVKLAWYYICRETRPIKIILYFTLEIQKPRLLTIKLRYATSYERK